jgi:uncharacterized protein (DUF302 family)
MDMIYKLKTEKTFEAALESLKTNLSEVEFGVLWQLNFKDKLQEKGLTFENNFMILEVCNPVKAQRVLSEQMEMGFFLPCKVAVYEEGGLTYIGMPNPTSLMSTIMVDNVDLENMAKEVELQLQQAIDRSV